MIIGSRQRLKTFSDYEPAITIGWPESASSKQKSTWNNNWRAIEIGLTQRKVVQKDFDKYWVVKSGEKICSTRLLRDFN